MCDQCYFQRKFCNLLSCQKKIKWYMDLMVLPLLHVHVHIINAIWIRTLLCKTAQWPPLSLLDDNKVYSWGNSNSGQLGVGTTETSPHPRPLHIGVSLGTKLRGITCGTRHSFVWTQDGDCFSFGNNYSAQLGYDFRKPDFKENQVWISHFSPMFTL